MIVGVAGAPVRRVVGVDHLAAVDQREHLARDVGLDVVAGVGVADLERAAAGQHLLDHRAVGVVAPRHAVDLAERHHRAAGRGVVASRCAGRRSELVEPALEQPHERAAAADRGARLDHLDGLLRPLRGGQRGRRVVERAHAVAARAARLEAARERPVGLHDGAHAS